MKRLIIAVAAAAWLGVAGLVAGCSGAGDPPSDDVNLNGSELEQPQSLANTSPSDSAAPIAEPGSGQARPTTIGALASSTSFEQTFTPRPTAALATDVPSKELPDGPIAPLIESETWLNTNPLNPTDLQGRVLVVEFWTYG